MKMEITGTAKELGELLETLEEFEISLTAKSELTDEQEEWLNNLEPCEECKAHGYRCRNCEYREKCHGLLSEIEF